MLGPDIPPPLNESSYGQGRSDIGIEFLSGENMQLDSELKRCGAAKMSGRTTGGWSVDDPQFYFGKLGSPESKTSLSIELAVGQVAYHSERGSTSTILILNLWKRTVDFLYAPQH